MSTDLMDALHKVKPKGDAVVEAISRQLCIINNIDPDGMTAIFAADDDDKEMIGSNWQEQAPTVEQVLRILVERPSCIADCQLWQWIITTEKEIEEKIDGQV